MGRLRLLPCVLASLCLSALLEPAAAQKDSGSWQGKRVMLKSPLSKLKGSKPRRVVCGREAILKVDKVQGQNLLVRCIGAEGWISRAEVVPFDEALAYYTGQLKISPRNSFALTMRGAVRFERHE